MELHGDDAAAWLAKWPSGAEWSAEHGEHLCDGCREEREDSAYSVAMDAWERGEDWS